MANIKIQQLAAKTTPDDTDVMIIEDAISTKKITWLNIKSVVKNGILSLFGFSPTVTVSAINGWTGTVNFRKIRPGVVWMYGAISAGSSENLTSGRLIIPVPDQFKHGYYTFPIPAFRTSGIVHMGLVMREDNGGITIYNPMLNNDSGQHMINMIYVTVDVTTGFPEW